MASKRTILVIGGTGAMGRSVVRALLADKNHDWLIRVFTRNSRSDRAKELLEVGTDRVEFAEGDLNDADSLTTAMRSVYGVFCNTNFWSRGAKTVARERDQGLRALEAAQRTGVQHFVYSSLDPACHLTGGALPVPHYDAKAAVEHEIDWRRSEEFMQQETDGWYSRHVSVLVAAPYFENFQSILMPESGQLSDGRDGLTFRGPLSGDAPWQMVALNDIGFFAAHMFANPDTLGGCTLRIASDEPTMQQVVET